MHRVLVTLLMMVLAAAAAAGTDDAATTGRDGEFAQEATAPRAADAVTPPPEERFAAATPVDHASLQKRLLAALAARAADLPPGSGPDALLRDPAFVKGALAWDAIRTAGAANLDALAARAPKYAAFLRAFLTDPSLMTLYGGAGLVPSGTAEGLRVLADIWARDRRAPDWAAHRPLAVGIAAAWGAGPKSGDLRYGETLPPGNGHTDPVWRYYFFKRSEAAGLLFPGFAKLRPWEIRFVAGNQWDDESLTWLQRRVNLPPERYGDACWAAPYSGMSEFGDTIQGPLYYSFCSPAMGEAERTVTHGGVCGALSHTGSTAACARGIPSYTCGQPGHCAYGFRLERGKWLGGFGGPDGGPHNWIFPGEAPTMPRLMEEAFADDAKVDRFVALLAAARAMDEAGNQALMKRAWGAILREDPCNYYAQLEFQQAAIRRDQLTPAGWRRYAAAVLRAYGTHGFAFLKVIAPVQDRVLAGMTGPEKLAWFVAVQKAIAATPPSWATKLTDTMDGQLRALGGDPALEERYLGAVLALHFAGGNDQVLGQVLEWAIGKYVGKGQDGTFVKAFAAASGTAPSGAADEQAKNRLKGVYAKAIVAAEQAKSAAAVRVLSERAAALGLAEGYEPGRKLKLPPGRLVSADGLLSLSSTSGYDRPCAHTKVISGGDGAFHTEGEETPTATVALARPCEVSAILIVKNHGNEGRSKRLRVSRSVDGATWFPVAENDDTPGEWLVTPPRPLPAKWIRVEEVVDHKEVFHLRNILVFGK